MWHLLSEQGAVRDDRLDQNVVRVSWTRAHITWSTASANGVPKCHWQLNSWADKGECSYGEKCRFNHDTRAKCSRARATGIKQEHEPTVEAVLEQVQAASGNHAAEPTATMS